MNRSATMLFVLSLAACSASAPGGGGTVTGDGGTGGGSDVVTGGGEAGIADSGAPRTDAGGTTPRDSGSTARDTGPSDRFNYGTCGRTVIQALCRCGMTDQNCQQTALQRSQECLTCMGDFQTTCCPTEVQAIQDCVAMSGCMDQQCAIRMCMSRITAATTCVNTRLQREAMGGGGACVDAYLGCLGDLPTMQQAVCSSF